MRLAFSYITQVMNDCQFTAGSVQLEITVLQRYDPCLVPVFVTQIEADEAWNHQVTGNEVEPREDRRLEHADVGFVRESPKYLRGQTRTVRLQYYKS